MKTRHFLFGALGLLLMASCAKDEVVDISRDGDEIAFNVATNANTRVFTGDNGEAGVYCNYHLPFSFYVWAITTDDQKTYINGDMVENKSLMARYGNQILNQANQNKLASTDKLSSSYRLWSWTDGYRYWPDDKNLDFYAAVNAVSGDANYRFNWNDALQDEAGKMLPPTITVQIPTDVAQQKDVLYAVMKDQSKIVVPENEGAEDTEETRGLSTAPRANVVTLNFRHALSQVVFTAQNPNEKLYVEVKGVSICNVKSHNTFTYPTNNTTSNNSGLHLLQSTELSRGPVQLPEDPTQPYNDGSWGRWGDTPENPVTYSLTFDESLVIPASITDSEGMVIDEDPIISLSGPLQEYKYKYKDENDQEQIGTGLLEYNTNAMLLLPQHSEAWVPTEGVKPGDQRQTGTYFLVDCVIVNIAGDELDRETDKCVYGTKVTDPATGAITYTPEPVAIPVPLYWQQGKKYIYNFVFGAFGGYDPEDPDPIPDLVPISFRLSVDEFDSIVAESTIRDTDMADEMPKDGE